MVLLGLCAVCTFKRSRQSSHQQEHLLIQLKIKYMQSKGNEYKTLEIIMVNL